LIPTTRELTTLGSAPVGTQVNLEVDVIAKYVERIMTLKKEENATGITNETLSNAGFL
jgi:riboflavin synthase